MKFRSRSEIINKIPNKFDAVMAISNRVKMLVEGKKRLVPAALFPDKNHVGKICGKKERAG